MLRCFNLIAAMGTLFAGVEVALVFALKVCSLNYWGLEKLLSMV